MTATQTDLKWVQDGLGPRQAKEVNEAFSAFSWAAKTVREITDHGQFDSTPMFGGSWSAAAQEAMEAIRTNYNLLVTRDNFRALIADLQQATAVARAHPRVVDKRSTPEERTQREVARLERERAAQEKANFLAGLTQHEYSLAETAKVIKRVLGVFYPATKFSVTSQSYSGGCSIDASWTDGPATIEPILDIFQCCGFDGMQDLKTYNGPNIWNGHLFHFHGDYVRGQRKHSAKLLLEACERFSAETGLASPEIAEEGSYAYVVRDSSPCGFSFFTSQPEDHPEGIICRDETGHLTAGDIVNAIAGYTATEKPFHPVNADNIYCAILDTLPKAEAQAPEAEATAAGEGGITVSENEERNGVEIRFAEKPDRATLDGLKARGWRWSKFSKCWYAKRAPDTLAFARRIAGGERA